MKIAIIGSHIRVRPETLALMTSAAEVAFYSELPTPEALVEFGEGADVLVTWGRVSKRALEALPKLKLLVFLSTGYEECLDIDVDRSYLEKRRLSVSFTPDCSTRAVAEYTLAATLAAKRRLFAAVEPRKKDPSNDLQLYLVPEFHQLQVGIVGLGAIGSCFASLCKALGMKVVHHSRDISKDRSVHVPSVALEELARTSDIIAITCGLTPATKGLIAASLFHTMKSDVTIVNSARGAILNLADAFSFFHSNPSSTLVIDELPSSDQTAIALSGLPNVVVTPHIAFNTIGSLEAYTDRAWENIESFLHGSLKNSIF